MLRSLRLFQSCLIKFLFLKATGHLLHCVTVNVCKKYEVSFDDERKTLTEQHLFPAHTVAADSTLHLIDIKTNIFACCPQGGTIILQMHVVQKLLQTGRTFMILY